MSDFLSIIFFIGLWYFLNKVLLPKMGVPT